MFRYIVKRILSLIPVVFIISLVLFGMFKLMPGDPVLMMMPTTLKTETQRQQMYDVYAKRLGLDKSIPEQYVAWVVNTTKGDFGYSSTYNRPVADVLKEPLKNSIALNVFSLFFSFMISIPVGIKSAVKRHSFFDSFWQVFSLVGLSIPTFFIGLGLIFFIAIKLRLLPAGGMPFMLDKSSATYLLAWGRYLILPVATLTIGDLAGTIRYVRNAMLDIIGRDYIRTARSKGLGEKVVIYSHAFRNALIPVTTLVSGSLVALFGGAAITETIFAWNGIGNVLIQALNSRDYMVVLTMNMFYAILSLIANLIMDIGYALVDPRVKLD
ncbi:MAG: ABC transporter permease [Erysipelothrix sp.]|jgi:peptide/nickel transport system permease protein|nr:ABC transporter permease [Erysipelothrix sp.]